MATWQQRSSALHIEMTSYPLAACWDFLPQVHPSELKEVQDNRGAEILILSVSQILCTRERDAQNYFFKPLSSLGPCSSAEVGPAGVSVFNSPRGPKFLENLPTQRKGSKKCWAVPAWRRVGLCFPSVTWAGQL